MKHLIVNIDKKEYLTPEAFGEDSSEFQSVASSHCGVLLGLTVLCADGNNRGGGDLRSNDEIIGTWAGDRIAVIDDAFVSAEFAIVSGCTDVPLFEQFVSAGKDVSAAVIKTLVDAGEGDGGIANIDPTFPADFVVQRNRLSQNLTNQALRNQAKMRNLDEFVEVFGVKLAETPYDFVVKAAEALSSVGEAIQSRHRFAVDKRVKPEFIEGFVMAKGWYGAEYARTSGIVVFRMPLTRTLTGERGSVPEWVELNFSGEGALVQELLKTLYPDVDLNAIQDARRQTLSSAKTDEAFQRLMGTLTGIGG